MSTPTSVRQRTPLLTRTHNSAGVSEDERGGIKPSSDNVLFAGVLSEAHMKLAMIAGVECLFRIASVRYGDNSRSRP